LVAWILFSRVVQVRTIIKKHWGSGERGIRTDMS
jgi:hypothetical protein